MQSRPLSSVSRILLVGCAVGLGASSLFGQSSTPAPAAPAEQPVSRIDVFTGYSYFAPHGTVNTPLLDGTTFSDRYASVDAGAIGSVAYYFNRYFGGQVEFGAHPDGNNDSFYTIQGGPIFRYPTAEGITPFVHALAGAADVGGPNAEPFVAHATTWGPALTVGGGLDYNLPFFNHHLALRLFQADYEYIHANFGPEPVYGGRANIDAARLSTGIVWKFGNIIPPPPVQYSCSANPSTVYPGDPITITGTPTNLNPKKTATYSWSGQGVTVKGDTATANVDTTGLQPGNFTVTGHVSEGQKVGQFADCTANFTVKQYEPPTVSCSVNPSSVNPGDSSTITATGVSPQNRPLTYSYTASAGSISGTGNTATLSTAGAPAGTVTVTANVSDDKGQTASGTCSVTINAPAAPAPKTQTLCSINFDRDKRRPARVDNEAKACLDDVALNAQRSSDASVVVVGNATPDEQNPPTPKKGRKHAAVPANLAAQRAVNTKDYLVKEKGIDASRIQVRTGSAGAKEVENYLVPAGATFDTDVPGTTAVDESTVAAQPRKALGTRTHHRAAHKAAAAAPAQ
jgi:outer membrane protein OmpA-like peptidoglycan-associated protein